MVYVGNEMFNECSKLIQKIVFAQLFSKGYSETSQTSKMELLQK